MSWTFRTLVVDLPLLDSTTMHDGKSQMGLVNLQDGWSLDLHSSQHSTVDSYDRDLYILHAALTIKALVLDTLYSLRLQNAKNGCFRRFSR